MMNKSQIVLALLLLAFAPNVFARPGGSTTAGDGGQGVFCGPYFPATNVELLDLYESRHFYRLKPELAGPSANEDQYMRDSLKEAKARVAAAIANDDQVDAIFKLANHDWWQPDDIAWYSSTIHSTHDYGTPLVSIPKDCAIEQMASFVNRSGLPPLISVREDAWDVAEPIDRVALLLHEVAHAYFPETSDNLSVRQFVLFVTAPDDFRLRNEAVFRALISTRQAQNIYLWH